MFLAALAPAQHKWPYSTFLGGAGDDDVRFVTSDNSGNTFLMGLTFSVGAPFSEEPSGFASTARVYIMKINSGGRVVFSKLLGVGFPGALAVDAEGNVFAAGTTQVVEGFATPGSFQTEASGGQAFLAKFGPEGQKLFATYFGTRSAVQIRTLSLDAGGRPTFCGSTAEDAVPLTASSLFQPVGRRQSSFCAQLSADGSRLMFSTLLGNTSTSVFPLASAIEPNGDLLVAGNTLASDFPLVNAFQAEDRRRSLYRPQAGSPYGSVGGAEFGTIISIQVNGPQVFVGTSDAGGWVSLDRGDTWNSLPGSSSGVLAAHPLNTRLLCTATTTRQLFCSTDGGNTWQPRIFSGVSGVVADPRVEGGFFVTTNQLTVLGYLTLGAPPVPINLAGPIERLTFDSTGNLILAIPNQPSRSLQFSQDRGATFKKIADNVAMAAFAPSAPQRLYAVRAFINTGDSLVIRSDNGGATWEDTTPEAPFNRVLQLTVDPVDPETVYAIQGPGAFRSTDGGRGWHLWNPQGLDNVAVQTISFDAQGSAWIGTLGSGNGFLMKLKINEPAIQWSTVLGGAGGGAISAIRLDEKGGIVLLGSSFGFDLPTTGDDLGPRQAIGSFAAQFDANGRLGALRYLGVTAATFDRAADGSLHLAATAKPSNLGAVEIETGRFAGGAADAVWLELGRISAGSYRRRGSEALRQTRPWPSIWAPMDEFAWWVPPCLPTCR